MSARRTRVPAERRVSDEEIVGWVSPVRVRSPGEEALRDVERIINEHGRALREDIGKLTLNA